MKILSVLNENIFDDASEVTTTPIISNEKLSDMSEEELLQIQIKTSRSIGKVRAKRMQLGNEIYDWVEENFPEELENIKHSSYVKSKKLINKVFAAERGTGVVLFDDGQAMQSPFIRERVRKYKSASHLIKKLIKFRSDVTLMRRKKLREKED